MAHGADRTDPTDLSDVTYRATCVAAAWRLVRLDEQAVAPHLRWPPSQPDSATTHASATRAIRRFIEGPPLSEAV